MKKEKKDFNDIMNGAFYSKKPIKIEGKNFVYNDGKNVKEDIRIFTIQLEDKIENIRIKVRNMAKKRNKQMEENSNSSISNDTNATIRVLVEMLLVIYEKISTTLAPISELDNAKKKIEEAMNELKQVIGNDYNKFLTLPFIHLNENNPETKMAFINMEENGLRKLTTENFELLFDKFFDQDTELSRQSGVIFMTSELLADKKVIDFLINREYITVGDVKTIVSVSKSSIYENMFYGGRLWVLGQNAPRLTGKKKKIHIKEYCHPYVFGNMYKEGKISLKELSEILSHNEILSIMYNEDVDKLSEDEKDIDELKNSYFLGDEVVELFKTKDYKSILREELSHLIWYRYVCGLFSLENLRELSKIKLNDGNSYFKISKLAEFYNDLENHQILKELQDEFLKPEPVKAFFTFDEIAKNIYSGDEEVIAFFNTSIRKVYENDGIDFDDGIIDVISKTNNKNEKLLNLYENGIISSSKLLDTGVPKKDLIELYKKLLSKENKDKKSKKEYKKRAKELLYEMSKIGIIDFIDAMDIVEQTVDGLDGNEDKEINCILGMINNKELSTQLLIDYYKDDDREEVTKFLFTRYNEEVFSNETMKNLQELFSYDTIQQLYNEGKIEYTDLKEIVGLEKSKEIDQRYDIVGKINCLIENGGIIGIEPDRISNGTGKKRVIIGGKKKSRVENFDKDVKTVFLEEIHNLDKEAGEQLEVPRDILLNSPVFEGFVLKPYTQFGIGILEGLEAKSNSQNSSMVVRLKEVLEAVQIPKNGEKINTSEQTIIGKAKSRTSFREDNTGIVLRVYHTKNWGRNILKACKELSTNNSDYFIRVLSKSKDESERINEMRTLLQYLSENYEENLKKKREETNEY